MRRVLWMVCLVGALGCSSVAAPRVPPTMTGLWNVTMTTAGTGIDHCETDSLVINFTQLDSTLTGVATAGSNFCNEGELPGEYELTGTRWSGGVVSGAQVSFQGPSSYPAMQCALTAGTMVSANAVTGGVATCTFEPGTLPGTFSGTWSATRVK